MRRAHEGLPHRGFTRPAGVVNALVCRYSGMLATGDCTMLERSYSEVFVQGTVPANYCETCGIVTNRVPAIGLNGSGNVQLTVGQSFTSARSMGE